MIQPLSRRQVLRGLAGLGALPVAGALLAACSNPPPPSTSGQPPAATSAPNPASTAPAPAASPAAQAPAPAPSPAAAPAASPAAPAAARAASGRVVVAHGVDVTSLDPHYAIASPELNTFWHIFDSVLDRDPKTLSVVPGLAREWKNIDELTWEFKLNPGVKFHNGETLDAQAVKFTLDRMKTNTPKPTHLFATQSTYDSTEVIDDLTFRVKTSKPVPIMVDLMVDMFILPPKYYTSTPFDDLQRKPVGSGPFVFKEWLKDDHVLLEANPNYWRTPATIQQIVFKPIPELSTRVAQLQSGEADIVVNVAPDQAKLLDSGANTRAARVQGGRVVYIGIRTDKPPLNDKRVRQALNYAIDFDTISKQILDGAGRRATSIVNPPHVSPDAKAYPYDLDKAKALLKEAGVPDGLSLTLETPSGRYLKDRELAEAVAQNLGAIGINVNVQVLEWSVFLNDRVIKRDTAPLYLLGLGAYYTGQQELYRVHKDNVVEATHWNNAEYHSLYDQLTGTFDTAKRQEIMNRMQAIADDDAPWIFLWYQTDIYGVSKRLRWEPRPDERINLYAAALG